MGFIKSTLGIGFTALNVIDPYFDYKAARDEGSSVPVAVAKAATSFALWQTAAPLMTGLMVKDLAVVGLKTAASIGNQQAKGQSKAYGANFGGDYYDSQGAYTMRQRSVQAIQNSQMNGRSVLGSEARMYSRNGR